MKSKLLYDRAGERIYAVVFDTGDEVASGLLQFARDNKLQGASFTAIGAFRDVTLGYFEIDRKQYKHILIREQVEVVSLIGNIADAGGQPKLHAHVVVGKSDGSAHGGHLVEAHVRPTLEVVVTETPAHLRRVHAPATGLALIQL